MPNRDIIDSINGKGWNLQAFGSGEKINVLVSVEFKAFSDPIGVRLEKGISAQEYMTVSSAYRWNLHNLNFSQHITCKLCLHIVPGQGTIC